MTTSEIKAVKTDRLEVAFLDEGEGPVVVCLHGFPDVATTFVPMMEKLVTAGFRCVAPWMRGYWPTSAGEFADEGTLVADVVSFLAALGIGEVDVVGHDWGADVAYGLGAARPDLVRRMVTLAVPHTVALRANRRHSYEQLRRSFYIYMFQVSGLGEDLVPEDDWHFIRRLWQDWSPGWEAPSQHLADVIETLARPGVLTATLALYRSLFDGSLRDPDATELLDAVEKGPVRVPTLLLMGERDGCIAADVAIGAEQAFEAPYLSETVSGVGHFLHLERPDEVAARTVEWFDPGTANPQ